MRLDDEEIARLIEGGEGSRVEFKERLEGSAPERIREAVCAFANDLAGTQEPGIVVVGLRDDMTSVPVADETLLALTNIRRDGNTVPPPALLVERRSWKGREIAVVTVLPSDSPPVRYRGAIHVRNGPRRAIATAQEERILNERRRFGDRPFDLSPVPGSGIADLSCRRFEDEYLPNSVSSEMLAANDRSQAQRMAAAKMIASVDDDTATILGLLVLGIRPRDFIPGAYIQFLRIDGATLGDEIVDSAEYSGTVSDMLQGIEEKLRAHNRRRIDLVSENREVRTENYPLAALQQLVRNAIMHRSYEATNAPVRVTWFDDRIEIQNSGGSFGAVTPANFGEPGAIDYRNPNLAEAMKVLGYVQRFGVGIQTAQRLLREAGCPKAEFEVEQTHILATVRTSSRLEGLE